jgi:hypothetical protein
MATSVPLTLSDPNVPEVVPSPISPSGCWHLHAPLALHVSKPNVVPGLHWQLSPFEMQLSPGAVLVVPGQLPQSVTHAGSGEPVGCKVGKKVGVLVGVLVGYWSVYLLGYWWEARWGGGGWVGPHVLLGPFPLLPESPLPMPVPVPSKYPAPLPAVSAFCLPSASPIPLPSVSPFTFISKPRLPLTFVGEYSSMLLVAPFPALLYSLLALSTPVFPNLAVCFFLSFLPIASPVPSW